MGEVELVAHAHRAVASPAAGVAAKPTGLAVELGDV